MRAEISGFAQRLLLRLWVVRFLASKSTQSAPVSFRLTDVCRPTKHRRFETMRKLILAALAALMLAGALAGASEFSVSPSAVLMLGDGASPAPTTAPFIDACGDSMSR